ncbi:mating-type protein MAT alpha 1-domain-containing protein [Podospora aff. communis PSN243]|uniref:Mating-type protein MAT alpha 1-domain-containing protein n=1 Tax=Podospora aff. communis PSN243 TaxID=3040156 RepID=A0AAV9GXU3_9PEZI|nr:mating-type protein MAT alpha 1-domain-containing protein [Podospora aff. communis PSN243]
MSYVGPKLPTLAELRGNRDDAPVMQRVVARNPANDNPSPVNDNSSPSKKKKVNGFIGFRSYYSVMFSRYQQKQRSPFMTTLWKQDPFHNEWDFMCSTYSFIRSLLADEGITLQMWISFSVGPLGIIKRDDYMRVMCWTLVQHADGTPRLHRSSIPTIERTAQPLDSLSLFNDCLKAGLRVSDPAKFIAQLAGSGGDVMCINPKPSTRRPKKPVEKENDLVKLLKSNPELAMSQLLGIPLDHPRIASGVEVYHLGPVNNPNSLPQMIADRAHRATHMPPTQAPLDESEFDALFRVWWGEAGDEASNTTSFQAVAMNATAEQALMLPAQADTDYFNISQFHN